MSAIPAPLRRFLQRLERSQADSSSSQITPAVSLPLPAQSVIAVALAVSAAVSSCSPMPGSLQTLRQEHAQVWCSWSPPLSYGCASIDVNAPYSKWGLNQCFFDSATKCQLALNALRWRAQWRVWFPEKPRVGGCGICNQPSPCTYEQELETWHEREDASICMSLDDPRVQDTDDIQKSFIFGSRRN
jgi:hypothetical protein